MSLFLALVGVLLTGLVLAVAAWSYTTQPPLKRRRGGASPEGASLRRIFRTN